MRGSTPSHSVALLSGGLGGARLAPALRDALGPGRLSVICNVGDDLDWHGLRVCPDLDSVTYALAGVWDSGRGWGLRDETFHVRDALAGLDGPEWFNVGDRDLAYHLLRSERLRAGRTLSDTTRELLPRLGVTGVDVLPASDEPAETRVLLEDGRLLHFQEWYVGEGARPKLAEVRLAHGKASEAAVNAIESAETVILGPSNPVTSIGAILALDGVEEAVRRASRRVAVSPVVSSVPMEDDGARHHANARQRALATLGRSDTPGDIAGMYAGLTGEFVVDHADSARLEEVRRAGLEPVQSELLDARSLANALVAIIS